MYIIYLNNLGKTNIRILLYNNMTKSELRKLAIKHLNNKNVQFIKNNCANNL
jgi:hypothetical protein